MDLHDDYNGDWFGNWSCIRCNKDWVRGDMDPRPCPVCGRVDKVVKVWVKKSTSALRKEQREEVRREMSRLRAADKVKAKANKTRPVYIKPPDKNTKPITLKELKDFDVKNKTT